MEREITIDIAEDMIGGRRFQDILHDALCERKSELKTELLNHIKKLNNLKSGDDFLAFDKKMEEIALELGDTLRLIISLDEDGVICADNNTKKYVDYREIIWRAIGFLANIIHEYKENGYPVDLLVKLKDSLKRDV